MSYPIFLTTDNLREKWKREELNVLPLFIWNPYTIA